MENAPPPDDSTAQATIRDAYSNNHELILAIEGDNVVCCVARCVALIVV